MTDNSPMSFSTNLYCFPFLSQTRRQSQFNARKKFQYAILCVRAMVRIKRLRYTLEPLRMEESLKDPYRVKILRKVMSFASIYSYYQISNEILLFFSIRFWTDAPSVSMGIGSRKVRVKIGPHSLKIHKELNYMQFIWRISQN